MQQDVRQVHKFSPLHLAILFGEKELVEELIDSGANIYARDAEKRLPKELCTSSEIKMMLLNREKSINLLAACKIGDQPAVKKSLFDTKALVNKVDSRPNGNKTPLHWAVIGCHYEVAKLLLSHGASLDIPALDGKTAIDIAKANADEKMISLLSEYSLQCHKILELSIRGDCDGLQTMIMTIKETAIIPFFFR